MKLFNRFRIDILKNKAFLGYFTYAIGEMVLVILGILTALQIDNWNNDNQDLADVVRYMNTIESSVSYDKKNLNELMNKRALMIESSQEFLIFYEKNPEPSGAKYKELLKKIFEHNAWELLYFQCNDNGFEALKYSGFLRKVDNEKLTKKLYDYYFLVEKIKFEEQNLNNFISELEIELFKNNVIPELRLSTRKLFNDSYSSDDLKSIENKLKLGSFNSVQYRTSGSGYLLELYSSLITLGDELVALIHEFKSENTN